MKQYPKSTAATIVVMLLLLPVAAITAYSSGQDSRGPQGGPPPEAIKACAGKSAGDTTSFKGRRGETLEAICREIDGKLAAVPAGGPKPPQN